MEVIRWRVNFVHYKYHHYLHVSKGTQSSDDDDLGNGWPPGRKFPIPATDKIIQEVKSTVHDLFTTMQASITEDLMQMKELSELTSWVQAVESLVPADSLSNSPQVQTDKSTPKCSSDKRKRRTPVNVQV